MGNGPCGRFCPLESVFSLYVPWWLLRLVGSSVKLYAILADCFIDQEFQCIKHDMDEELRMFLGRILKPYWIVGSLTLWYPILILSLMCVKLVCCCYWFFVCFGFFFKSANMAFGKHSLDQAFSRSEHDNFYTKICAKDRFF